jgi:poly-gamma-glutamate synthesis protein (capsule biosynthesis protein)
VIVVEPIGPPSPPPLARPLRVIVGGDVIPHRPSLVTPASIRAALAPLAPTFAGADAVIANYEAATGDVDAKSFRLAYAAPHGWLEELPKAGIRALTVANNHACDLSTEGLDATLAAAARSGAIAIGGDTRDPWAARPIVEQGGKRICAVGWTTVMNAETACSRSVHLAIARADRKGIAQIDTAISRAKAWCDATIAIIHGGQEYVAQTREVMDQARHAADAGADAVVIHHPHIASPIVVHATRDGRKVPVFASVGNLASNQGESWKPSMFPVLRENRRLVCVNGWTRMGVLADLAFDFGTKDATKLEWGFHLTWTENEHANDHAVAVPKIETRLLDPEKDAEVVAKLSEDERGPVDLFDDPCWLERPVLTPDEAAKDSRCSLSNVKQPPGAQPVMVAKATKPAKSAKTAERPAGKK